MFEADLAVKRSKLSDEVFERLLGLIRAGRLKPGDRLPPERRLAQAFDVSRASLRDAIRQLEMLGYLEVRQGDGTMVRHPDGATVSQPFRSLLAGHPHLAADLLEFRQVIEPQAAALAAKRCTPEHARQLEESLAAQRELARRGERLNDRDLEFHQLVAQVAGNVTLLQVIEALQALLQELRDKHLAGDRPRLGVEQHAAIARAIIGGDGAAAKDAMVRHLASVEESVLRAGAAVGPGGPDGFAPGGTGPQAGAAPSNGSSQGGAQGRGGEGEAM